MEKEKNKFDMIVNRIFNELEYEEAKEVSINENISINIYKSEKVTGAQYYIVSACNVEYFQDINFNELQNEVYSGIKELINKDPAVDKNTSWLVGVEINDNLEKYLSKILLIEENPYYFKKMVCPYSLEEIMDFSRELEGQTNYIDYMQGEIKKVKRFTEFYDRKDKVYDFIARLMIKLPLIELQVGKEDGLSGLANLIESDIKTKELNDIYAFLKDSIDEKISMIDEDIDSLHTSYYKEEVEDE